MSIEPIVFVYRTGNEHTKFGDPYDTVCTIIKIAPTVGRIVGLVGKVTKDRYKALKAELLTYGITEIIYERIKP